MDTNGDVAYLGGINQSQTLFAKRSAPPVMAGSNPFVVALLILGIVAALVGLAFYGDSETHTKSIPIIVASLGVMFSITCSYFLYVEHARVSKEFRDELDRWERTWVCTRCGVFFEPQLSEIF